MTSKWIRFTVTADDAPIFHAALKHVETASKSEAGCVHYAAFVNREAPCEFTVLEIWDNEESLEAHRQSPHLAEFKSQCGGMIQDKSALELVPL